MLESWINIHVLFGSLLGSMVTARFMRQVKHSPRMLPADIRALSRRLSRIVYLLLYVVIGLRQTMGILGSIWHGGSVDFKFFDMGFRHGPDYAGFNPKDDFQLFLASGLLVLILIRVSAFAMSLRSAAAAAPTAEQPGFQSSRPSE
jgi:cytochrome b561